MLDNRKNFRLRKYFEFLQANSLEVITTYPYDYTSCSFTRCLIETQISWFYIHLWLVDVVEGNPIVFYHYSAI